jgi:hypothetical protein
MIRCANSRNSSCGHSRPLAEPYEPHRATLTVRADRDGFMNIDDAAALLGLTVAERHEQCRHGYHHVRDGRVQPGVVTVIGVQCAPR